MICIISLRKWSQQSWKICKILFSGMNSQFMFPSDQCSPGDPGAIAPAPAALVTIQPDKEQTQYTSGNTRVVSVSVQDSGAGQSPTTPTHCRQVHLIQSSLALDRDQHYTSTVRVETTFSRS